MVTKAILGLAALLGLAGVGLSLAESRTGCCSPGTACCFPGSPCCADDCCAPGSPCCAPGALCCAQTAAFSAVAPAPAAKADRKGGCCAAGCAADQPGQPAKLDAATSRITVDGMSCAGCAKTVGKTVSAVEGVASAVADVKTKTLTVTAKRGASPSPKALWEAVEKAGYTPTRIEGAAGTFDKKPVK